MEIPSRFIKSIYKSVIKPESKIIKFNVIKTIKPRKVQIAKMELYAHEDFPANGAVSRGYGDNPKINIC